MSMNKSDERSATQAVADDAPEGIESPRATVIEVTYDDDGVIATGLPQADAYAGDEIILLAPPGEARGFSVWLSEDFPLDRNGGTPGSYPKVEPAGSSGTRSVGPATTEGRNVRSGPLQVVRLRIDSRAAPGRYGYGLDAEIPKGVPGVALAGGVIIRPTPPPRGNP